MFIFRVKITLSKGYVSLRTFPFELILTKPDISEFNWIYNNTYSRSYSVLSLKALSYFIFWKMPFNIKHTPIFKITSHNKLGQVHWKPLRADLEKQLRLRKQTFLYAQKIHIIAQDKLKMVNNGIKHWEISLDFSYFKINIPEAYQTFRIMCW